MEALIPLNPPPPLTQNFPTSPPQEIALVRLFHPLEKQVNHPSPSTETMNFPISPYIGLILCRARLKVNKGLQQKSVGHKYPMIIDRG